MTHTLNRRAVLASVPAIVAGTLPSLSGAAIGAADLLPQWLAEVDYIDSHPNCTDKEMDYACDATHEIELRMMAAPVRTLQDLAAKLVVSTAFGAYDDMSAIREAANLLGLSRRISK